MHFALRVYLFIALAALLGIAGAWTDEPAFDGAWMWPAFLLLAGLCEWPATPEAVDEQVPPPGWLVRKVSSFIKLAL